MKLKNYVYWLGWLFITGADVLMGYRTAQQQFGFSLHEALLWAVGFAMMSIPLKVIYERLVIVKYHPIVSHVAFISFSLLWLYLAFMALSGLAAGRSAVARETSLDTMALLPSSVSTDTLSLPKGRYSYLAYRTRLLSRIRIDSLQQAEAIAQRKAVFSARLQLVHQQPERGFLYLTLLLLLSGAVVLQLATGDPLVENSVPPPVVTASVETVSPDPVAIDRPVDEPRTTLTNALTDIRCTDCGQTFRNRQAYAGHFKYSKTCNRGNFELTNA